jgi:ABC-type nitrate/sulfonate/bicarbonate transport system substrate-binding protein
MMQTLLGRGLARLALFAVALLALVATASADPLDIRIAWTTVPGQLTPVLFGTYAQEHLLKHYGKAYTVSHTHFAGSGPMVTALASGQIDIAQLAPSSLGFAIENAHLNDIRILTDGYQDGVDDHFSIPFLVRKDSGITTIAALKGKVVAVNAFGGALDIAARAMLLKHHFVADRDYTIVEGAFPNLGSMLEQRKVDLIGLVLPFSEVLEKRGNVHTLFRMKDVFGQTQMLFNVARASFLDKNHAALQDFFDDYVGAQRWLLGASHREEAVHLVAQFTKRPDSVFMPYLFTAKDVYRNPDARPNMAALQRNMAQLKEQGLLKASIDVKRYAALGFIDDAVKRLKR